MSTTENTAQDLTPLRVMSETIYYLGWLYPIRDLGRLVSKLFKATRTNGRFLMCNTSEGTEDHLVPPLLIHTYRDLFLNVGYHLEAEEVFRNAKDDVDYEGLITLYIKPPENVRDTDPDHV